MLKPPEKVPGIASAPVKNAPAALTGVHSPLFVTLLPSMTTAASASVPSRPAATPSRVFNISIRSSR